MDGLLKRRSYIHKMRESESESESEREIGERNEKERDIKHGLHCWARSEYILITVLGECDRESCREKCRKVCTWNSSQIGYGESVQRAICIKRSVVFLFRFFFEFLGDSLSFSLTLTVDHSVTHLHIHMFCNSICWRESWSGCAGHRRFLHPIHVYNFWRTHIRLHTHTNTLAHKHTVWFTNTGTTSCLVSMKNGRI